jgi:hypothetical protein
VTQYLIKALSPAYVLAIFILCLLLSHISSACTFGPNQVFLSPMKDKEARSLLVLGRNFPEAQGGEISTYIIDRTWVYDRALSTKAMRMFAYLSDGQKLAVPMSRSFVSNVMFYITDSSSLDKAVRISVDIAFANGTFRTLEYNVTQEPNACIPKFSELL